MRTLLVVGLALGTVATIACSSSSPPVPNADYTEFCTSLAKAQCGAATICASDVTTCESTLDATCLAAANGYIAAGRAYQQPNAQACIDAWNNAVGGTTAVTIKYADLTSDGGLIDKCNRVFQGSAASGKACTSNYDCAGSLDCSAVGTSTTTLCATPTAVAAGGFCDNPGDTCATDTYCAGNPGTCVAAAAAGAACGATTPCVSADRCVDGVCQARAGVGDSCSTDADCGSAAPYCDPYAGNICTIGLEFATQSADCKGFLAGEPIEATGGGGTGDDGGTTD